MHPVDKLSPAAPVFPPARMPENPDRAKPATRRQRPSRRTRNFVGSDANHLSFSWLLALLGLLAECGTRILRVISRAGRPCHSSNLLRRGLDRFPNPHVRRAATKIAPHRFFNVLVRRFRRRFQQRNRAHYLSALAVATLDDVFLNPGILHNATHRILSDRFNGSYLPIANQ